MASDVAVQDLGDRRSVVALGKLEGGAERDRAVGCDQEVAPAVAGRDMHGVEAGGFLERSPAEEKQLGASGRLMSRAILPAKRRELYQL